MIKPQNDQSIEGWSLSFWSRKNVGFDKLPESVKKWSCDCCGKTGLDSMQNTFSFPHASVVVSGLTYLGCSIDCVRSLFTIHHQYALSELLDVKLAVQGIHGVTRGEPPTTQIPSCGAAS